MQWKWISSAILAASFLGASNVAFAQAEVPFGVDTTPGYNGHTLVPVDIDVGSGIKDCPGGGSPCNVIECPGGGCDPEPFADLPGTGLYAAICSVLGPGSVGFHFYVTFPLPGDVCSLSYSEYRCTDETRTSYDCPSWTLVTSGVLVENITDDQLISVSVPGTLQTGHRLMVHIGCGDEGGDPNSPPIIHSPLPDHSVSLDPSLISSTPDAPPALVCGAV
jgi:hypothetical protein